MHVAITGASSGIGEAIAREYARAGADLTLVARRRDLLDKLAQETKARCHVVAKDLSDPPTAADWIEEAEAKLGPIDVLVNNAGMEHLSLFEEMDVDAGDKLLRLNLLSPLHITRAILPRFISRRKGTIVDVASVAALAAGPGFTWYGASKAGLAMASEALRAEVKPYGIHVLTVYPGPVHSDMAVRAEASLEKTFAGKLAPYGTSDVLARRVKKGVERRKARIIYPRFYTLARWFPNLARFLSDRGPRPIRRTPEGAPTAGDHKDGHARTPTEPQQTPTGH
jgi:short-subunit dehydrogenase